METMDTREKLHTFTVGDRLLVLTKTYGSMRYYTVRADGLGPYIRCGKRGTVKEYIIRREDAGPIYIYFSDYQDSDEWRKAMSYDWQRMEV